MAIKILRCKRCNHEWASRKPDRVKVCPKCKSPYFDRERKPIKVKGEKDESKIKL